MSSSQGLLTPPAAGGVGGAQEQEETEDLMGDAPEFVIKNLDTGTQMRIDDFDRLAHIATDPDPASQEAQPAHKKGGLMKGTKALKHWTQTQAKKAQAVTKKAVTHVKEVAHELHVKEVLAKHKLPFDVSPSGRAAAEAGPQAVETPRPLLDLLRRSTGESSSAAGHEVGKQQSGSLASVSVPAGSEVSTTSQGSGKQHSLPAAAASTAAAAVAGASPVTSPTEACSSPASGPLAAAPALPQHLQPAAQATTPRSDGAASAPGLGSAAASQTAAAAATPPSPQPVLPAVVRLVSHKVSKRPYEAVVLAQLLGGSSGVVWVVAASQEGAFLATAGQDCVLRVWQLTASRSKHSRSSWVYSSSTGAESAQSTPQPGAEEAGTSSSAASQLPQQSQGVQQLGAAAAAADAGQPEHAGGIEQQPQHPDPPQAATELHSEQEGVAQLQQQQQQQQHHSQQQQQQQPPDQQQPEQPPVIEWGAHYSRTPVRQYHGHTEDILDVSWSSSGGFLLSASLDKTVRLWHLTQPDCLRTFEHSDFVTSVQFHPTDAQRFVSGSLDGKIRVWSILDASVVATVQLHQDMVTAVSFSLTGGRVMAGTMRGRVRFYDLADGKLEYVAQVDVRNQRGQHASGKKVTSIAAVPGQPQQFLITTNDSRLRLLEGYGQVLKYKGHKNSSTQARAALSPDGAQLACGSDDGSLYLWQRTPGAGLSSGGAAAAEASSSGRAGAQQRGGGSGGGGVDRARSMAAAAAAQYQHLMSKNASFQAFQANEAGQPVTAVAFVPTAAAGLPKFSVLLNNSAAAPAAAGGGAALSAAAAAEAALIDSKHCFVQQLLVSAGFNGCIRVHELLGALPTGRSRS